MMTLELKEELASYVSHLRESLPLEIKNAIDRCNSSLYRGPLYFDKDGGECSCFDEGAKGHNFSADLDLVRSWADDVDDLKVETDFDHETEQSTFERVEGSGRQAVKSMVGRDVMKAADLIALPLAALFLFFASLYVAPHDVTTKDEKEIDN